MTAPTAVRLTQQLEEVAAVDLTGDAEAPVAALVVEGEVVDGVDIFLPMKGQVSIPDATAEIVEALDRLTTAIEASAIGGTVTIDDTDLPVLVAALGAAIETAQDLADATEAAVGVGEWEPLLPLGSTFSGAGWYDPSEFIDGAGLRWRHARGQIEVQGRAIYLDGSGSPAVPAGGAAIATLPTEAQPADPAPLVAWETPADLTDITTVAARVDADGSIHAAPVTTFAVTLLASTLFDPTTP